VSDAEQSLTSPDELPRGRHRPSREAVATSQRQRIMVAAIQCIGERGYHATTVADIVAVAKVSRTTFYQQFTDKENCFLSAYNFGLDSLEEIVRAALKLSRGAAEDAGWRLRVAAELSAYLEVLAAEPRLARCLHVEVLAAGPSAQDQRARLLGMIAMRVVALNEKARAQEPRLPEVPPEVFALYAGGLDELVRDRLRTGDARALKDLAGPILTATFALFGA
jgi:AcrR family transcriptional regulator